MDFKYDLLVMARSLQQVRTDYETEDAMNTIQPTNVTPLHPGRRVSVAVVRSAFVRFSDEVEGEQVELFLQSLLVACLLATLALCQRSVTFSHRDGFTPTNHLVAATEPPPVQPALVQVPFPYVAM